MRVTTRFAVIDNNSVLSLSINGTIASLNVLVIKSPPALSIDCSGLKVVPISPSHTEPPSGTHGC